MERSSKGKQIKYKKAMKRTLRKFIKTNGKRILIDINDISFCEEVSTQECRILTKQGSNISLNATYVEVIKNLKD